MDEFIERLPIRVAALAGLIVGAVSLYRGTSLIGVTERVAAAMLMLGVITSVLRLLVQQSALEQNYRVDHMGRHLDATMPGMTADDLGFGEQGDRGEIS